MLDKELFELCKEVYKLTKWEYTKEYYDVKWGEVWTISTQITSRGDDKVSKAIPLYTSDYLADKLRNYDWNITNLNTKNFSLQSDSLNDPDGAILGDSLTKVLLEFVIALVDEGEKL